MRNKFLMFFVAIAAFTGFTSKQLEATSALPSLLVIQLVSDTKNSIVLSTNTLGMSIDADISSTSTGTIDEQLIGYIEFNACKTTTDLHRIKMTQMEQWSSTDPGAPDAGLFGAQMSNCGNTTAGDRMIRMVAVKVYTNVNVTSTDTPIYVAPTQATATADGNVWSAPLTTITAGTYCGFIGVLSFYMIDDISNSVKAGTYIATMQFSIQA